MRLVRYTDAGGLRRAAYVLDTDTDDKAPRGIPAGPNIEDLDWDELKREINNILIGAGLYTWNDVQNDQASFNLAITTFKRRLIGLYRRQS